MKKQKKFSAVIASFAMLLIVASSLGTATAAWFTRGTEAAASGFDFTASAASGIQISTDAETWKSSVTDTDFDTTTPGGAQENNRITVSDMEPVSTVDSLSSGEYTFYGATSGDGNFTLAADTSNYLVFDLYFLNQGADDLTLSLTSSATVTDGINDQDTSLATRVGFVVEGSDDDVATAIALSGGVSSYIWEPNSTDRSASALASGATADAKYYYNGISSNNGGTPVSDIDAYGILESGAYSTLVNSTKDMAIGDTPVIGTIPGTAGGGQITKVKVFVWMEGQDVDCNNGTSAGDVDIALAFDSGEPVGATLADKTATVIDTPVADTEVTVSGTGDAGATYTAYILQTVTDATVSLDYRLFLSTGSDTYGGSDITLITLDTAVANGTYQVVVVAELTGYVGSRTSASLTLS